MIQRQDLRRYYIKEMFADFTKTITAGIWLNGFTGEGEYKMWYDGGQLYLHNCYKNGKLNGEYKSWYKNGQLHSHSHYKNGTLNGEYKRWYDDGKISEHCFFKDGKEIKRIK